MRKRNYLLIAAMMIVATAVTFFVGCKKEKHEAQSQFEKTKVQDLVNQICTFQTLCESVSSGTKAEGVMSVEEMRQVLDLTTNYEHSEHMTNCENTILDTLYLNMPPVDEDGNVSQMDVVATYWAFEAELQQHMEMSNDGRNLPSYFGIIMPGKGEKAEDYIMVVFIRGEEREGTNGNRNTYDDEGPFIEDVDDWFWGDNLGKCKWDPYNATADASERLSQQFGFVIPEEHQGKSYIISNVVHVNYRPCEPLVPTVYSHYYVDMFMEDCADTWLFCNVSLTPNNPCIYWNELNCYWYSINRNIVDSNGPLHHTLHPDNNILRVPYHCCYISWHRFLYERYYYQVHVAHVTYCDVLWIETPAPPVN